MLFINGVIRCLIINVIYIFFLQKQRYPSIYRLKDHLTDTAKNFRVEGHQGTVSFITSMTQHFCGGCNRLRLMADGNLKVCLFGPSEVRLLDQCGCQLKFSIHYIDVLQVCGF